jgi:hypothetical protein
MQHIIKQSTMIGRNSIYLLLIISVFLTSCRLWEIDNDGAYSYISYLKNSSEDTIKVTISSGFTGYLIDTLINPNEKVELKGNFEIMKENDVIRDIMFSNNTPELVQVFHFDTLKVSWKGPASEMDENIHHFFNFNSWDVNLTGNKYTVVFTIYESDLTENTR